MQTQSYIPLIVCVLGLVIYFAVKNPAQSELKEAGRILATVLRPGHEALQFQLE